MKLRNEISKDFQWDFTHLFASDEAWENEYNAIMAKIPEIEAYKGTCAQSAEALAAVLNKQSEISERYSLVAVYSFLRYDCDGTDTKNQELNSMTEKLGVAFGTACSFIEPEIAAIPDETLREWMEMPCLLPYRHGLEDSIRQRAHILDEKTEALLSKLSPINRLASKTFQTISDVDFVFPDITDENGNSVPVTHGNFLVHRENPDRKIREQAFESVFGTYRKYINTMAALYAGNVKKNNIYADIRGYSSACEASLSGSNIPLSVYSSLVEAVHDAIPSMTKYLELRKKALGLDSIDYFDIYIPMVADCDYPVSYDDAKELVKKATAPLGERYGELLDRAYAEHWIDVYENKGKRSGAYSCGVHGVHPYVLMNYADSLGDAYTLAHELGHAMHSYFSSEAQDYENHSYQLVVAEVASTCNEVLLTKYLLEHETDRKRKAYILNHFLEGFRTTIFRQTLFAEFEYKAHEMEQNGTPLTPDALNKVYADLVKQYYAGAGFNDVITYEWSFIPHFYRSFYVYQYATGFSAAVKIASDILKTGDASAYLRFLSMGGSDYPINELKVAGVDLTSPEVVKSALKVFDETIDDLQETLGL